MALLNINKITQEMIAFAKLVNRKNLQNELNRFYKYHNLLFLKN